MQLSTLFKTFIFSAFVFSIANLKAQTVLTAGDIAVIGIKTSTGTQTGNDAIKLLTLVELACNTTFIVTDNNWNRTSTTWFCNNDEFAVELTVTSPVLAGSVIYIDVESAGGTVISSSGALTKVALTSAALNWGNNFGLNAGGDNVTVLQGTRTAPTFIYAIRHNGTFASGGDCTTGGTPRNHTGLPTGLVLGTSAVQMASSQDQWHYDCSSATTTRYINTKAALLTAIATSANWTNAGSQQWNASSCTFNVLDAPFNRTGTIGVSGAGCGCLLGCNLTAVGGPNCSPAVGGNCTAGQVAMFTDINVPAGCTYRVYATMREWTSCITASGMDAGDQLRVDRATGGVKPFVTGASNATVNDNFTLTGPGTIRVSGTANRADEVIVYRVLASTCTGCAVVLPIELVDFSAFGKEQSVELSWATAVELNNELFEVERSLDGINYETIGMLKGAGNYQGRLDYHLTDQYPANGINYYRLKSVDFDGSSTYSNVIAIEMNRAAEVSIYPNPLSADRILNIRSEKQVNKLSLYNVWGQKVLELENPEHSLSLPTELPNGFYTIALDIDGTTVIRKIVFE